MPLPLNTRLGRYEILSQLGAGGMGEVYRARDPKINRDVAIKVLPSAFSADEERLRRFEQEAQAAGALNHPNILAIYDVDAHDGYPYVVSELLEGETLHELMGGIALPPRKAVDYALQIAHGLAAAHERGIVHRDLKPENLFVTADGRVKILDFGIAKLIEPGNEGEGQTEPATRLAGTDPGMAIGTAGYMSPEQVRGQRVDHRSDIFSFGTVLYEMLAGRRAFVGDTAVETLNAILKEDPPDLPTTGAPVSPALERIVTHCLEKNPEQRFQSARDLAFALEAPSGSIPSGQTPVGASFSRTSRLRAQAPWAVAGAALLLAALALAAAYRMYVGQAHDEMDAVRLSILPPEGSAIDSMALSPDGRYLAFTAPDNSGKRRLWVRPLGSLDAQPLAGTEGASSLSGHRTPDLSDSSLTPSSRKSRPRAGAR
ncbi:MAG TPA: serine/threonine-protein kinase [Gemmatimonadaceae bacterium]|nr:serine/threonine-protein kinase [Gemmatimonadaceae bacterium]